jgi:hypothetical protein
MSNARATITFKVNPEIVPHLPSDDAVHADECAHVRATYEGIRLAPMDQWMCADHCPLRRSLEVLGEVYRTPAEEAAYWKARLESGDCI